MTPRWRGAGVIAALGLALAVVAAAARQLADFDLPWHLALGRATLALGHLPLVDDFSYTFAGQRAADEILADTTLFVAWRLGGALGLQLLSALTIALTAWLLARRARPAPWPIGCAFAALALMAAGPWLIVRPALFSFACLAALLLVVDGHRRGTTSLWPLVPIQLLWSNLHGFAVLGPALAFGWAGYALLCRVGGGRRFFPAADGARAPQALAVAMVVAIAACVSPLGWHLYTDPFVVAHHGGLITEWTRTSLGFVLRYDLPLVVLGVTTLAALLTAEEVTAFDCGVALVATVLALTAVRLIALGAILAAPLAARLVAPRLLGARLAPLLIAVFGVVAAPAIASTPDQRYGLGFDAHNLPSGASRYIAAHHPEGAVFNFLPFGGWLTFAHYPDVHVFIDGRTGRLYPLPFLERYSAAEHDAATFAAVVAQYDVQWAVVRARPGERFSEPLARDRRFQLVYLDDCAAIYVRKDGPNAALAEKGYQLLRHLSMPPIGAVPPALRGPLMHDAALALAQDPDSLRALAFMEAAGGRR